MAYNFNGTTQYLSGTNPVSDTPLTFACWFKGRNETVNNIFVYVGDPATTQRCTLGITGAGLVRIFTAGSITNIGVNTTTSASTTTWNHACGVFTSNSSRSVYLNAGGVATNATNVGAPANAWTELDIGIQQASGTGPANYAQSLIAEVGIWNAALTQPEISSLAQGMACDKVRRQSLVFYAPLARDLIDVRGGRTITNNNTATVANHTRIYQ